MEVDRRGTALTTYDELESGQCFFWLSAGKPALGIKMAAEADDIENTSFIALNDSSVADDQQPQVLGGRVWAGYPVLHLPDARIVPEISLEHAHVGPAGLDGRVGGQLAVSDGLTRIVALNGKRFEPINIVTGLADRTGEPKCVWFDSWKIVIGEGDEELIIYSHPPKVTKEPA